MGCWTRSTTTVCAARHFKAHAQSIKKSSDASGIEVGVSPKKAFPTIACRPRWEMTQDLYGKGLEKRATLKLHRASKEHGGLSTYASYQEPIHRGPLRNIFSHFSSIFYKKNQEQSLSALNRRLGDCF